MLTVPGKEIFREDLNFPQIMQSGDSLLWLGTGRHLVIEHSDQPGQYAIGFSVNKHGRLATAHIVVLAEDSNHARRIAYDNIMSVLSELSFYYDVALDVAGYEVLEEATEVRSFSFALAGRLKPYNRELHAVSNADFRRLLAAYREGLNATNVFYQALSFYKVAEGVAALRKRQQRQVPASTPKAHKALEEFPSDANALKIDDGSEKILFQPYLGKTYSDALSELREQIRNAITHLGKIDDVIDVDRYDDVELCLNAAPVLKHIAHTMLDNVIDFTDSSMAAAV